MFTVLPESSKELIKPISTFQMEVFVLEHHVIAILAPAAFCHARPSLIFSPGLSIFQLVALGFHQQHLSAVGHTIKVWVVVAGSVQAERIPSTGGIAVPPVHLSMPVSAIAMSHSKLSSARALLLVQALGQGGSLADRVICDVSLKRGWVTILPTSSQL